MRTNIYGSTHRIGNIEFSVWDDGSLEIKAKGVQASLGGITLTDAAATATIVKPLDGKSFDITATGGCTLTEEAKKARADIVATLRELASDLENPRERITNIRSCRYWGEPLEEDEPFVETKTGERFHVSCALELEFCHPEEDVGKEKSDLLTQLEEKFPAELEARKKHETASVESASLANTPVSPTSRVGF